MCRVVAYVCAAIGWGSVCLAQTPAPPLPVSLRVPDRFARAAKNQSSAPSYLMADIVDDTTGEKKRVCIESGQLFGDVRTENRLDRGQADSDRTMRLVLGNPSRTYHFRDRDAWRQAQPRYSPELLATVEKEFRSLSTAELAERFDDTRTGGFLRADGKMPPEKLFAYCAAMAHVLTERGLLVGRGDFGNSLHVITPQRLAEDDRRVQRCAEQRRREEVAGRAFAARLPGYGGLTRQFRVRRAGLRGYRPGFCFSASLDATSPRLVDAIDWLNPVNKKTQKARYNWDHFLPIAVHVERLAQRHPWLKAWKASGPDRTVEAQIYGKTLNTEMEDDFRKDVVSAWKDAGLRGKPYCELRLRWPEDGEEAHATLYLPLPGSGENRSLVVSSYRPTHSETAQPGLHWLDRLAFRSYAIADVRQVVVVTPSGAWKQLTLPTRSREP